MNTLSNHLKSLMILALFIASNASAVEVTYNYSENNYYNFNFTINNANWLSVRKFELWVPYTVKAVPGNGSSLGYASAVPDWTLVGSDSGSSMTVDSTGEEYTRWESTGRTYDIHEGDILSGFDYGISSSIFNLDYPIRWKVSGVLDCVFNPLGDCINLPYFMEGNIFAVTGVNEPLPGVITGGTVSEPGSIALMGLGLAGLSAIRRRKQKEV